MIASFVQSLRALANSPTQERDLATMFSVFRLSVWFLFLNGFLIGAIAGVFWILSELSEEAGGLNAFFENFGFSEILTQTIFISMSAFLTIFVPIRVAGPIMGPRIGRYFDQIVLSGISPARYLAGKIIAQNAFLLLITAAALPYFVLSISLGGISVKYTLLGIGVLAVYTNVLALFTLLAAVYVSDLVSVIFTLIFFTGIFFLGFLPICPHPLPFGTSHVFLAPFFEALNFTTAQQAAMAGHSELGFEYISAVTVPGFGVPETQLTAFLVGVTFVAIVSVAFIIIGPLHSIVQENSTFGEVVLKGDNKRRSFLKRRPALRLRSEVSFFYENRPPWLRRWDFPIRWFIAEVIFLIMLFLPFTLLDYIAEQGGDDEEMLVFAVLFGSCWIILNNILFLKDRTLERLRYKTLEAGQIDLLFYLANLVMIAGAIGIFLTQAGTVLTAAWWEDYHMGRWGFGQFNAAGVLIQQPTPPVWELPWGYCAATFFLVGFALHFFLRWLSLRMWSKWTTLSLGSIVYWVVLGLLPVIPYIIATETGWAERYGAVSTLLAVLTNVSLQTPLGYIADDQFVSTWMDFKEQGVHFCLGVQLSLGLLFVLLYARGRKKLQPRELT